MVDIHQKDVIELVATSEDVIKEKRIDFEDDDIEFKFVNGQNCIVYGMFQKGTNIAEGIARRIFLKGNHAS